MTRPAILLISLLAFGATGRALAQANLNYPSFTSCRNREQTRDSLINPTPYSPDPRYVTLDSAWGAEDSVDGLTYAPVLRFAPGERYFPTLPLFTAFDGDNNGTADPKDLFDPLEIARRGADSGVDSLGASRPGADTNAINATWLRRQYENVRIDQRELPHLPAVFYRACNLTADDASEVWRYLRSDEQAWHRFGFDTLLLRHEGGLTIGEGPTPFRVIEYFFYYVADAGLEGHPNDLESIYIFYPIESDTTELPIRSPLKEPAFRLIVGAGHKDPAPNNVLVLDYRQAQDLTLKHPNILVELGGHSSAPDMPPYGTFTSGLDVNWHMDEVWGTRDVQATAGLGFAGTYSQSYTYPRDDRRAVTLLPPRDQIGTPTVIELADYVRVPQVTIADSLKSFLHRAADGLSPAMLGDSINAMIWEETKRRLTPIYSVIPSTLLEELFETARASRTLEQPDTTRIATLLTALARRLSPDSVELPIPHGEALNQAAVALSYWDRQMVAPGGIAPKQHRPWTHELYLEPTKAFRTRLHRPTREQVTTIGYVFNHLLTYGLSYAPSSLLTPHIGIVIPVFRKLPLVGLDNPVKLPGILEFQTGPYFRFDSDPNAWTFKLIFNRTYSQPFSWYVGVGGISERTPKEVGEGRSGVTLSAGPSFVVATQPWLRRILPPTRLRTGVVTDIGGTGPRFKTARWDFELTFQPDP